MAKEQEDITDQEPPENELDNGNQDERGIPPPTPIPPAQPVVDEDLMSFVMNQPAANRESYFNQVNEYLHRAHRFDGFTVLPLRKSPTRKHSPHRKRAKHVSRSTKRHDPRHEGKKPSGQERPGSSDVNQPGTSREHHKPIESDRDSESYEKEDNRKGDGKRKLSKSPADNDSACGSCGGQSKKRRRRSKSCSCSRKRKNRSCSCSRKRKSKSRSCSRRRKSRSRSRCRSAGKEKKCGGCTIL